MQPFKPRESICRRRTYKEWQEAINVCSKHQFRTKMFSGWVYLYTIRTEVRIVLDRVSIGDPLHEHVTHHICS